MCKKPIKLKTLELFMIEFQNINKWCPRLASNQRHSAYLRFLWTCTTRPLKEELRGGSSATELRRRKTSIKSNIWGDIRVTLPFLQFHRLGCNYYTNAAINLVPPTGNDPATSRVKTEHSAN